MNTLVLNRAAPNRWQPLILVLGALLVAMLMGLITSFLPWVYVIMLVGLPAVLGFSLAYPAVGVLVAFALLFQVVPEAFQPRLPFGGGKLKIYDLLLIYLTGVMLLRSFRRSANIFTALGPFVLPLAYLTVCVLISAAYVKGYAPNTRLLTEGRAYIVWALIPLTALAVNGPHQATTFRAVVIAIGVVVASYVCVQTLSGIQIIGGIDLSQSSSGAEMNQGVIRSIAGGATYVIAFAMYLAINRMMEGRWSFFLAAPLAFLMVAALGASFGRGVWATAALGLLVSAWVLRGVKGAVQAGAVMTALVAVMLALMFAASPKTGQALIDRVSSYGGELTATRGTLNWRRIENQQAMLSIEKRPFTGVGIGGDYKQTASSQGSFGVETVYIHNGYLHFPLKMGLHAALIPFLFIIAFYVSARRSLAAPPDARDRGLVAALSGAFAMMVAVSFTQPEWVAPAGIAAYSVLIGMLLQHLRFLPAPVVAAAGRR